MMTETALVVESRGNRAVVQTLRTEACAQCAASGACATMGGGKQVNVEVLNYIRAKAGDRVELSLPESTFLTASLITYAVPLACLIGGAVLGKLLAPTFGWKEDYLSMTLAGIALAVSVPLVMFLGRRYTADEKTIPRITRVLPPVSEPTVVGRSGEKC